jgi:hypothetical protein
MSKTPTNKRALERAQLNKRSKTMKTLYTTQDGREFLAASAKELVTLMRRDSDFDASPTNEAHMNMVAKRTRDESGITLSTESPEAFIASMLEAGLIVADDADEVGGTMEENK